MRGKHNKLGEGERKVRLGQDSLPNIAISVAETSGYYIRCFTRTLEQATHKRKIKGSNACHDMRKEKKWCSISLRDEIERFWQQKSNRN